MLSLFSETGGVITQRTILLLLAITVEQVTSLQLSWRTKQLNVVDLDAVPEADDDASLYRLFGFALHVGMKFRKKATHGHLRSCFCLSRRRQYAMELAVLKTLVETDKSILPAVVRFQDL